MPSSNGPLADGHIVVGRVGKPFGLQGEVYVHVDPDLDLEPGEECHRPDGAPLLVEALRSHKGRTVVAFEGVEGRDAAEALRGTLLTRPRTDVGIAEDMIWVADLIGRQVVDDHGELVGVVERILDGPAHDYLVLARPDGGEALIPMVDELLDWSVDPVVVTPPDGLLDPGKAW